MNDLEFITRAVAARTDTAGAVSAEIWAYAELAYGETQSAKALCEMLVAEGFTITSGIAGMPTAFTACFVHGSGKPVVGVLGEYDALDTLSQQAGCTHKQPITAGAPGHGCGHNLLGVAGAVAAAAIKDYLCAHDQDGTVVYFGCPAEEGAGAKQFMARAGVFDAVDFVYTWHPAAYNEVSAKGNVAIMGANFTFRGISAHAGGAPQLGRSALDAAELMNVGVNYLREHMIDKARIHYAFLNAGGTAANIVQDCAVLKYEVRAPKVSQMQALFDRVVKVAGGAAMMTETTVSHEITMAFSDYLPNKTLARVADQAMHEVGAPQWSEKDYAQAREFLASYDVGVQAGIQEELIDKFGADRLDALYARPLDAEVHPFNEHETDYLCGSTDVGDVGYAAPTVNINLATACLGNVGHSWQMVAQSNSEIGRKGMMTAAKVLALAAVRTMADPDTIAAARAEYNARTGGHYSCPLPDSVTPPIDK